MSFIEDTNLRNLMELLAEIHNRETVLPDFQRDFVWQPSATRDLIVSIANNYPAGSILRLRDGKREFAVRVIENAPSVDERTSHTFLVLDGQQRLTSLYQAFYGKGKHRYFLDLRRLLNGDNFEDVISFVRVREGDKQAWKYDDFANQVRDMILPLSHLREYKKWVTKFLKEACLAPQVGAEELLDEKINNPIEAVCDYQFPVVTLKAETGTDVVCTIFEKLNSTGKKLGVFDLLTARFRKDNVDLRQKRDEMLRKNKIFEYFDVDPQYVLQAVSWLSRKSSQKKEVLKLDVSDIDKWWDKAVSGLVKGLEILRDDCKVMSPKWVPYETMFPVLAAVHARVADDHNAADGARREKIKRWFWCSVFSQSYNEGSAVTRAMKDTKELLDWFDGKDEPDAVKKFKFDPNELRETTVKQRAIYRGTICLTLTGGARDFYNGAEITAAIMDEKKVEAHHVFPKNYLKKTNPDVKSSLRDCVLNMALIRQKTNRKIRDRAPSDYLAEMREDAGGEFDIDKVLESHLCPSGENSALFCDDFECFLQHRQGQIQEAILRATGAPATGMNK